MCSRAPLQQKEQPNGHTKWIYACYNKIQTDTNPRAAIYVSKTANDNVMYHDNLSDQDTCTISFTDPHNTNKRIYISSVYMPCENNINTGKFLETIKLTEKKQNKAL